MLLVAEKYQTGFDQPLLHTMYVDKRLAGIPGRSADPVALEDRIHPLKEDTFVFRTTSTTGRKSRRRSSSFTRARKWARKLNRNDFTN